MSDFRSILDVTRNEWLDALQLEETEIPEAVVVEGSWWRAARQASRLSYLSDVRELAIPDVFWGRSGHKRIAFAMAYGAARAVEIIHIFGVLGSSLAIQIGTCGGLQAHLRPGDVVVPGEVRGEDGVAHLYGRGAETSASALWVERARTALRAQGRTTYTGRHVTFSSLFSETVEMMALWQADGFLSVDMETATTMSVAEELGLERVSLLVVWDELTRGRRFLDPMADDDLAALNESNRLVYEVALGLIEQI